MTDRLEVLQWEAAASLINGAQQVIVVGHQLPDGDAVGSLAALGWLLRAAGKDVTLVADGFVPATWDFVPGAEYIRSEIGTPTADAVICVDSSDPEVMGRTGAAALRSGASTIVIDHHLTNTLYGKVHLVRSDAVATCDILFEWAKHIGWPITAPVADCLLTGILTDTLTFSVGQVSIDTFVETAELMASGGNFRALRHLTGDHNIPLDDLRLYGLSVSRAQVEDGVAWSVLETEDLRTNRIPSGQTSGAVDILINASQAVVAAEFTATQEGDVRVSMRAIDGYDVGRIAVALDGGGHARASGCTLPAMTTSEAVASVLPLLKEEARRIRPKRGA